MSAHLRTIDPPEWASPVGYTNGVVGRGETLFIAGQIGWNAEAQFETDDLAAQFAQALDNVIAVVRAAGGEPTDIARMTIYVTDLPAYRAARRAIGAAWRARLGQHYPAMALLCVAGLLEPRALVEIEATALLRSS